MVYNNSIIPNALSLMSEFGDIFDISAYNLVGGQPTTYANLAAALGSNGANVPLNVRRGGMTVKFINSTTGKYEQWRYMGTDVTTAATFTDVSNWQGVDETPTAGSKNLVTSGGVYGKTSGLEKCLIYSKTLPEFSFLTYGVKWEDGTLSTYTQYSHTSPIQVSKNDVVYLTARCPSAYCAVAKTDSTGTTFTPSVQGNTPDNAGTYIFIAKEDGYISITSRADITPTIEIYSSQLVNSASKQDNSYINRLMLDTSKTYLVVSTPSVNFSFSIAGLYPVTNVDWGDGTSVVPQTSSDLVHVFNKVGVYIITLDGLTTIPNGSQVTKSLYDRDQLIGLYIGSTVTSISALGIYGDKNLKEVHFLSNVIPTLQATSIQVSGTYPIDIIVPDTAFAQWIINWKAVLHSIYTISQIKNESNSLIGNHITVTVGSGGDFTSLNDAIIFISSIYPTYRPALSDANCLKAEIKILSGTTIAEQILVSGIDLSYISITSENYTPPAVTDEILEDLADGTIVPGTTEGWGVVNVDCSSFGNISHDSRGFKPLFRAENNGHLPQIACIFKAIDDVEHTGRTAVGYFCNRSSSGLVRSLCGFIGFGAGVISNNESSITIREGITMNCSVWGCHARHNGEVSARSVVATGCATDTTNASQYGAAVADRVADMDVREAYLGGNVAIRCHNASTICARATHVIGGGVVDEYLVEATYSGKINASEMTFDSITQGSLMFKVTKAGWIDAFSVTNKTYNVESLNTISGDNGIIWG